MTNDSKVLYKKFRTTSGSYIYDTYSNEILTVSKAAWDLFPRHPKGQHRPTGGQGLDSAAIREIDEGLAEGFLQPCDFKRMHFYESPDELLNRVRRRVPGLSLEVTERCNFRCHYCPFTFNSQRMAEPRDMTWQTALDALTVYAAHSRESDRRGITFWGGEPLLNFPLIRRVVEHIHTHYTWTDRLLFALTTNASLVDKEVAKFFVENGFSILVSLDGPEHVHDVHRVNSAGEGTFQRTMRGLQRIREVDAEYYSRCVRFNSVVAPGADIASQLEFFERNELLAGRVQFTWVNTNAPGFFGAYGTYTQEEGAHLREMYCQAAARGGSAPNTAVRGLFDRGMARLARRPRGYTDTVGPNGCCAPLLKKMHVDVRGDIHLCERIPHWNAVGNVSTNGIDHARVERLFREYVDNSLNLCRHCWAVRLCTGCYKEFIRDGRWNGADRQRQCRALQRSVLSSLKLYASICERNPSAFDEMSKMKVVVPV